MNFLDQQPIDQSFWGFVPPSKACPGCGENRRRILRWHWLTNDVQCWRCLTTYNPFPANGDDVREKAPAKPRQKRGGKK